MPRFEPTWQTDDGRVQLYLGDCLEILPQLPKVDAVVVDIPYGEVNRASSGLRNLDRGAADVPTFSLLDAVTRGNAACSGSIYVWCGTEQVSELRRGFVDVGMTTRMCGWEKTNPSPMNGEHLWLSSFECCVFGRKSHAYFAPKCQSPIWRGPVARNQQHPTEKPVWLMKIAVEASVPVDGTALDFCSGSGTTGIACIRLGRKFIGIEIEPKYFEIAKKRIQAELAQGDMFRSVT